MLEEVRLGWCPHLLEVEAFLLKIRKTGVDGQVRDYVVGWIGESKYLLLYGIERSAPYAVVCIPIETRGTTLALASFNPDTYRCPIVPSSFTRTDMDLCACERFMLDRSGCRISVVSSICPPFFSLRGTRNAL